MVTRYSVWRVGLTIAAMLAVFAAVVLWARADRAAAATAATLTVASPATQQLGVPFSVPVSLSNVSFDANSPNWVGYDFELDYDSNVVQASASAPSLCQNPAANWATVALSPGVVTGCAFQSNTTTSGVLETVTFTCVGNGVSALHLPPHHQSSVGNALFDQNSTDFAMTLNDGSVTCGTGITDPTKTPTPSPTITPTPIFSATATPTYTPTPPPSATLSLVAPASVVVGDTFQFTSNVSDLMSQGQPGWAGYDLIVDYNGSVLRIDGAAPNMCAPVSQWANLSLSPSIHTGCVNQSNGGEGLLETYTATCLTQGTSTLHFKTTDSDARTGLFDKQVITFGTFVDTSVDCVPGTPGPSATPTFTSTPTPVNTAVAAATLGLQAPAAPQSLQMSFPISAHLSSVTFNSRSPYWAGYNLRISFDPSILEIDGFAPGLCPSQWTDNEPAGVVDTGCAFQQITASGLLDTFTARCIGDGVSALHMTTSADPGGTFIFSFSAEEFLMTLQDTTVTCDHNVDADGDGCASSREAALGLNPADPWDFYSVPVPSLLVAPKPLLDLRDSVVGAGDAQAIFAYFKAGARVGNTIYNQDLNGNGIADGVEYDRTVIGPAMTGPPDGVVSATEAQAAFAQFKRGYAC